MRYFYRKAHVRAAVRLYDFFGGLIHRARRQGLDKRPDHVCFVVLHQIGDAVISLPAIRAIMASAPSASFSMITGEATAPIFRDCLPNVEIIQHDADWHPIVKMSKESSETSPSAEQRLRSILEELKPDAAIVFHPDLFANRALARAGVPCRIGFGNGGGGFWLTNCLDMADHGHQSERTFVLASEFGTIFGLDVSPPEPPSLQPSQESCNSVERLLGEMNLTGKKIACLHPFGRFPTKDWNAEGWAKVVEWLCESEIVPVVVGGPKDRLADRIGGDSNRTVDVTGRLTLPETAALFAKTKLFIGVDSGPAHIAAAVGCPVVSVFSVVNSPERWAPKGEKVAVVTGADPSAPGIGSEAKDIPPGWDKNPYTAAISPDEVIQAAETLIYESPNGDV